MTPDRRRLEWLPHQMRVLEARRRRLVMLVSGLGGGKTRIGCRWAIDRAWANHPIPVYCFEPTYPMVRRVLRPGFQELCDEMGLPHRWMAGEHIMRIDVAGRRLMIPCLSASNSDHVKGPNIAAAWIDEAGQVDDDAIKQIRARVRHPGASVRQMLLTGTPEGMRGAFYDLAEGDVKTIAKRRAEGTLEVIRARTGDNPFLPPGYVEEELGDLDPHEREQYELGLFVPPRGRVYGGWSEANKLDDVATFERHGSPFMACDFNVMKMSWCCGWILGDRMCVTGELIADNTDTEEHAQRAREWWRDQDVEPREVTVYGDAAGNQRRTSAGAGRTDWTALSAAGFRAQRVPPSNPAVRDRVFALNAKLRRNEVLVSPSRAPETVRSLSQQERDQWGEPDKSRGLDHMADALGYAVARLWPRKYPSGNGSRVKRIR